MAENYFFIKIMSVKHLFRIVSSRWRPFLIGIIILRLPVNRLILWYKGARSPLGLSVIATLFLTLIWGGELARHTYTLIGQAVFKWGIALFILSEIMLFFSFFWTYLHFSLNPVGDCGFVWPSSGVLRLDAFSIPALNTLLLLRRGCFLTAAHHALIGGLLYSAVFWWVGTILLGLIFLGLQGFEYYAGAFSLSRARFGSIFYLGTGFHGMHVCAGLILLLIAGCINITRLSHTILELAAWYWHFVDVVWLGLFTLFYWWL